MILDLNEPTEKLPTSILFWLCDISKWSELTVAFAHAGEIDIAVANAGISEETDYFGDTFDEAGVMLEPKYAALEVNFCAVVNFVKLALSYFRMRKCHGSIVIISSATAYAPEQSLAVYSACKLATTDVPKGVMIPHASLVNLIQQRYHGALIIHQSKRILLLFSIAFDGRSILSRKLPF